MDAKELAKQIMDNAFDAWTMNREAKQYMGAFDLEEAERIISSALSAQAAEVERLREALVALLATHDEDEGMDEFPDNESVGTTCGADGVQRDMPLTFGILRRARLLVK